MADIDNIQPTDSLITINDEIKKYLLETSKWCKFLAIVGYIGIGFLILAGIAVAVGFSIFSSVSNLGFPMGIFGFVYIIIGALYFFPINYMYKFSDQLTRGLKSNDQKSVNYGFENLKSLFKFAGIFTIVVLSIYGLIIVVAIPMAIFTAAKF